MFYHLISKRMGVVAQGNTIKKQATHLLCQEKK
jgi:hypothetical protein